MLYKHCLQPVGFVTFHTRAGAEAAKQDLQVGIAIIIISKYVNLIFILLSLIQLILIYTHINHL